MKKTNNMLLMSALLGLQARDLDGILPGGKAREPKNKFNLTEEERNYMRGMNKRQKKAFLRGKK